MTVIEAQLIERLKKLPPSRVAEVMDFGALGPRYESARARCFHRARAVEAQGSEPGMNAGRSIKE